MTLNSAGTPIPKYYRMPKVFSLPKNLKRFTPAHNLTLLLLQGFTFGVYNTRLELKAKGYNFRTADILPVLILGELSATGGKVNDLQTVLGFQKSVAQRVLTRIKNRGLVNRVGGGRGRGYAAKYYLSGAGVEIYDTLTNEMGKSFTDAKKQYLRNILVKLNRA